MNDSQKLTNIQVVPSDFGVPVIATDHRNIHKGISFISSFAADVGNGASIYAVIVTPNSNFEAHMTFSVISEAEAEYTLYENVSYDTPGTATAAINRDRNSSTASTTLIYRAPGTPSIVGATALQTKHWGAGKTTGAENHEVNEYILKRNTKYFLLITNATTSNNYITWWLNWYEEEEDD